MTLKSVLIVATGMTTLGGIGVAGFWFSQPKNIKDYLLSERKTLLDTAGAKHDASEWKILFTKHKESTITVNGKQIAKLLTTDIGSDESAGITKLKTECNNLFNTSFSGNEQWKEQINKATDWCTLESPIIKEEKSETSSTSVARQSGTSGDTTRTASADQGREGS